MKEPFVVRAMGPFLLGLLVAGYGFSGAGVEPAAVQRSVPGRLKPQQEPTEAGLPPLGPSLGVAHYQQALAQPPLSADVLAGLQREPVTAAKGRLPMGLTRAFDPALVVSRDTVRAEEWTVLTNGWRIWSAEVASPGALGLRVHLEALALPRGARLLVYDPARPTRARVAAVAEKLAPTRETWGQTLFAEQVVLECQVPPGADTAEVNFALTGLAHLYRLPKVVAKDLYDAGPCHNDVACYPDWAQEAAGVAEMLFEDQGSWYLCTGCLLNSGNTNTVNEYFLSAHHCIPNQAAASTLELYWFYQNSVCGVLNPPSMDEVPQTGGGADLLATSSLSDFAFMQLREAAPPGVYYLGWSREAPTLTETLTCIHHPQGDYKRISFGHESSFNGTQWWVQWDSGVTEQGSSGSPLLNARHQVIGQLYGGLSDCSHPKSPDEFRRFDVTYKSIQRWLDPVSALSGTYYGLCEFTNSAPPSGGTVTLTLNVGGKFTGKLLAGRTRYTLGGQFDTNGNAQVTAPHGSLEVLTGALHLDITGGSERITGLLTGATWTATLAADRAVYDGRTNTPPQQGTYTLVLSGKNGATSQPAGDGYATVSVDKSGHIRLSGLLADGTKVTQSTGISKAGQWPLYIPLYGSTGLVLGWLTFSNTVAGEVGGDLAWVKPAGKAAYYPGGFSLQTSASGARYTRPATGQPLLNTPNAVLVLTGGNPAQSITDSITLNGQKSVSDPASKLRLSFTPATGIFRGSVAGVGTTKALQFSGVVLANQNLGLGCFLSGGQSGRVMLQAAP